MKKLFFLFICSVCFLSLYAQQDYEYIIRGDQAMEREDYREAQSWYSEGLENCNKYCIMRLTEIWQKQPKLRRSMRLPIQRCYACLQTLAENEDRDAMLQLSDYYKDGIGMEPDSIQAVFWLTKLGLNPIPDEQSGSGYDITKTAEKNKTRKYRIFATYTYSPTMPVGFTVGTYDKFGLYFSYKNDFQPVRSVYNCDNQLVFDIYTEDPPYSFNRKKWHSSMVTGGFLFPIMQKKLIFSVGGGYGFRDHYWEIVTDKQFYTGNQSEWVHNVAASYEGYTLEAGAIWSYKQLIVSGGVNTTGVNKRLFNDLDVYLGVGFSF